jgi:hypothetical protein
MSADAHGFPDTIAAGVMAPAYTHTYPRSSWIMPAKGEVQFICKVCAYPPSSVAEDVAVLHILLFLFAWGRMCQNVVIYFLLCRNFPIFPQDAIFDVISNPIIESFREFEIIAFRFE